MGGGVWAVEDVCGGNHSPLSLAGDAWPAAAPGGVAGERERVRQRGSHGSERGRALEREWGSGVLPGPKPESAPPPFVLISFFFFDN